MPAKRVKRKYVRKVPLGEQISIEEKIEVKPYMECPFCNHKQYTHLGRDETSSWCEVCGRCFSAIWKKV